MTTPAIKTRKWTTVLPLPFFDEINPFAKFSDEDEEENLINELEQLKEFNREKIKIAISPRHYSLIDGKKTNHHRHIIFEFANPRYYSPRIKEEIKAEKFGFNRVDPVRRSDNLERYFLHLDDQSKSQHSKEEIIYLNGMKEFVYETKTKSEIREDTKQKNIKIASNCLENDFNIDFDSEPNHKRRGRPKANRELKKRMTLSLFPSDYAELQRIADEKRTSASAIVQDLIVNYIIEYKE